MNHSALPVIGVTLDSEKPGGYSKYPWYALRTNYLDAIAAAGGLPIALSHDAHLAEAFLDRIDGLVVTGGAFDVDPALYGGGERHGTVTLKERPHRGSNWRRCAARWRATCRCWASAAASSFSPSPSAAP